MRVIISVMAKLDTRTFKRLIKKRSYLSVFIIVMAIAIVYVSTNSIGLVMLSLFLAGLFMLYQAFSGRKMRKQFLASAIISFAGLAGVWITYPEDRVVFKEEVASLEASFNKLVSQVSEAIDLPGETATSSDSSATNSTMQDGELYQVDSVTDGDTIKVQAGSKVETIRFIGIDTPEVYGGAECYGKEASSRMKQLAEGKRVRLEVDPSQGDIDRYNRLLRFVFTEDGQNIGEVMLREGYAREYTYNKPYRYLDEFIQAESDAKEQQLGLWSPNNC